MSRLSCSVAAILTMISIVGHGLPALAQSAPSPSSSPSAASATAPSSPNSMPIEGTILAYQGLQADADNIATAIEGAVPSGKKVVVATPGDVLALLQLRIVLSQIATLNERLNELRTSLYRLPCRPPAAAVQNRTINASWISPFLGLFSSPTDISGMISAAASVSSSNVTVASQPGSFVDATLMNMVAESLNEKGQSANAAAKVDGRPPQTLSVFVPGVVPPNISTIPVAGSIIESSRNQSFLFAGIRSLETNRTTLQSEIWAASHNVSKLKCKKDADLAAVASLAKTAAGAADAFESGLLGGSLALPSTVLQPTSQDSSKKPAQGSSASATSISNTINVNPAPPPSSGPSGPSALQQLLYIDLMLHQLAYGAKSPVLSDVYLLSVHALESGASELTRTQTFLGTRQYYSGGAAATFTLTRYTGAIVCSGLVYGYRGFIKADDIGTAIGPIAGGPVYAPGTRNLLPAQQSGSPACRG